MLKRSVTASGVRLIVVTLAALLTFCHAAANVRDSIATQLQRTDIADTTRILLLCDMARTYKNISADTMTGYAADALQRARRSGYKTGEGLSLVQLGHTWFYKDMYDSARRYYQGGLQILEQTKAPAPLMECTFHLGLLCFRQAQFDKALEYWTRSLKLARQLHDDYMEAQSLIKTGGIYHDLGNFSKALKYYLEALAIFERMGDKRGALLCLTNLATVYSNAGNKPKAREYVARSVKELEGNDNIQTKLSNYCNVAQVYGELKDDKNAARYFHIALHMADSIGNDYWKNICYTNLGTTYLDWNKNDSAYLMFSLALKGTEKVQDVNVTMAATGGLGSVLLLRGQYKEAIGYLQRAYDVAAENKLKQPMFEIGKDLVTCYEKLGDYPNALRYHKEHLRLRNELYSEERDRQIQQLQFNHDLAQKEDKIALLEKDRLIANARTQRQRVALWALVVGLGLVLIISIQQYSRRRLVQRSRDIVQRQKDELAVQAAKLAALNSFKDKTFSILSHDMRSPINSVRTTLSMMDEELINAEEFMQLKPEIMGRLDNLSSVLDNLLKWSASYMQGQAVAQPRQVMLQPLAAQCLAFMGHTAQEKQVTLQNNIATDSSAWCDAEQIDIVLRNLVANAIKFSRPGGSVVVDSAVKGDKLELTVKDNGIGMPREQLARLFTASANTSTFGTAGEKGIGLGLLLCYEFVMANKGTITVQSQEGMGTTFTILLPAVQPV